MAYATFDIKPRKVPRLKTRFREIKTPIPHPKSVQVLKDLRKYEPPSMGGQPPVLWSKARDFSVWDDYGNRWIDFSSGVLVANCGHLRKPVERALKDQITKGLIHNYCFANRPRAELARALVKMAPKGFDKCFLLTTGAEAVENAIKLARTHGIGIGGKKKNVIITFQNAFHGRTLGAQMAGGLPSLKDWIINLDPGFAQIPFPDGYFTPETDFAEFEKALRKHRIRPQNVAGVMMEPYQGISGMFADKTYIQKLKKWCNRHKALLISDEVQAGFGRTGKLFAIQHYGILPDLICCGKGISGGLPLSAVLGNSKVMGAYGPGEMTSTHSGNPLVCRGALESVRLLQKEKLVERSRELGKVYHREFKKIGKKFEKYIGAITGKGLMVGVLFRKPGTKKPDGDMAFRVAEKCIQKGLMVYAPLGLGGATIKMNPPLIISKAAMLEGISVFEEAVEEVVRKNGESMA